MAPSPLCASSIKMASSARRPPSFSIPTFSRRNLHFSQLHPSPFFSHFGHVAPLISRHGKPRNVPPLHSPVATCLHLSISVQDENRTLVVASAGNIYHPLYMAGDLSWRSYVCLTLRHQSLLHTSIRCPLFSPPSRSGRSERHDPSALSRRPLPPLSPATL